MGINSLRLTPELIATLYPESLVDLSAVKTVTTPPAVSSLTPRVSTYAHQGKNLRHICILVNDPQQEFQTADQREFLYRILAACKITPDDIVLINTAKTAVCLEQLSLQFKPQTVFLWGNEVKISDIKAVFADLEISKSDGIQFLPVYQAASMIRDHPDAVELKKKLWSVLKKIFSL